MERNVCKKGSANETEYKKFAEIKDADIIIDDITVIAGENNTGKSTVGKVLFSLFNSLQDIDNKILEDSRVRPYEVPIK